MRCDLCKKEDDLIRDRIKGRIGDYCEICLGAYDDYLDGIEEDKRIEGDSDGR